MRVGIKVFKNKIRSVLIGLVTVVSLSTVIDPIFALASETVGPLTNNSEEAKNGIVQVNSIYTDPAGAKHIVLGSTGFIIGNSESGEYVITLADTIAPSKEVRDDAFMSFGVEIDEEDPGNTEWDKINLSYQVVVEGDVTIGAQVVTMSRELGIAVLELEQPIFNRTPLTILSSEDLNSEKPYKLTESVCSLGFPKEVRYNSNVAMYDEDDVAILPGNITNIKTYHDIHVIEHDCVIGGNNKGGPLINDKGYVIGVNCGIKDGEYYCAVDSAELIKVLDALGIEYSRITTEEINAAQELEKAEDKIAEPEETEVVPVEPEKQSLPLWIWIVLIGLGTVVSALLITLIIVLAKAGDKKPDKEKKVKKEKKKDEIPDGAGRYGDQAERRKVVTFSPESTDTSILSGGNDGSTTVLGGATTGSSNTAYYGNLLRRKNGENHIIDKPHYTIGKDSLHVELCIKDNSAISRQHAVIEAKEGRMYITDLGSTNGTFLNGVRIAGGEPKEISYGDTITIADEEFSYRR